MEHKGKASTENNDSLTHKESEHESTSEENEQKEEFTLKSTLIKTASSQIESVVCSENIPVEMATSILASIEKLKGRDNYSSWKYSMENYLALEDLTGCLTGAETDSKKCAKAKAAIALSIDKTIFVHVKSAPTVKEIWSNLQKTFEDKGIARRITLMRKVVNTKLENCESMDAYVSEIMSATQKMTDLGFVVSDEWLAVFLLCGLTEEYQPMIMALEGMDKALSNDVIKTKLLQEISNTNNDEKALFAKNFRNFRKKTSIICYTSKGS